jgi:hypothetical protein
LLSKGLSSPGEKKKAKAKDPVVKVKKSASRIAAKPAGKKNTAAVKKPAG